MDTITLSSDEEDTIPSSKKIKLNNRNNLNKEIVEVIISDDEEDNSSIQKENPDELLENKLVANVEEINEKKLSEQFDSKNPLESECDITQQNYSLTASLENSWSLTEAITDFVNICVTSESENIFKALMEEKGSVLIKAASKFEAECTDYQDLKKIIKLNKREVLSNPRKAILFFQKVYEELKFTISSKSDSVDPKKIKIINALHRTITKLRKKIRNLEEMEVNWDEEEDSSYIKMQRYRERAAKLYRKYCGYMKEDHNRGNICYGRLDFSCSTFPEINRAIDKKYKNNNTFPTYQDMHLLIQNCVEVHNLKLSEPKFTAEVKKCFKELGNLLQKRRKLDLSAVHNSLLENLADPATSNSDLDKRLRENHKLGESKINEICEKYVQIQEQNGKLLESGDDCNSGSSDTE